ncbi:hypothetical protein [Streptomyces sp. NPDC006459]|uniref:hypothetical protein n=1 Tax=Streptomyces sp. NPDC006459 TaxID=3154303 RepID=UPI0033AD1174
MRRSRPDGPAEVATDQNGFRPTEPPAWMRWLPFVYVAFVLLLEAGLREEWAVSFFLIALPPIAAYAYGPVVVAAFTVLAILLEGALAAGSHHLGENHHVTADIATAVVGILSTALAAHRSRQERHLVHANSVAEALMRALLRPVPHQVGHVLAASLYRPSEAGTMVGGGPSSDRCVVSAPAGRRAGWVSRVPSSAAGSRTPRIRSVPPGGPGAAPRRCTASVRRVHRSGEPHPCAGRRPGRSAGAGPVARPAPRGPPGPPRISGSCRAAPSRPVRPRPA